MVLLSPSWCRCFGVLLRNHITFGQNDLATVVVNRRWLQSLGPELEAIVREESRKAEEVFGEWNINDIRSKEEIWKKNGGEIITMSPDESKRYVDAVSPVAASILSANPKVKEDYEALLAAAKRYR